MKTKKALILFTAFATLLAMTPALAGHDEDARIVSAVKNTYVYRTHLKDEHIKVQSKDGVVTLNGTVASAAHKDLARDTVENLPGVKTVNDQLVVKPADEKADAWITFKVQTALRLHRSVSATRTTVSVKDGVVTLGGTASSGAQKELAGEYAQDIEGVKDVKNEMNVVPETPPRTISDALDDASITAQVKAALLTHRSTSSLRTKVATRNGVVTLNGDARSQAEKDLVTKLTKDINGVKSVVNDMEVKP